MMSRVRATQRITPPSDPRFFDVGDVDGVAGATVSSAAIAITYLSIALGTTVGETTVAPSGELENRDGLEAVDNVAVEPRVDLRLQCSPRVGVGRDRVRRRQRRDDGVRGILTLDDWPEERVALGVTGLHH